MSDELEDTERSRILELVRSEFDFPVIGEVQAVHRHTGNEDIPSNHEVDVSVPPGPDPIETYKRRPVIVSTSGVVTTPEKGDLVVLIFPKRASKPYVVGTVYGDKDEDRAPLATNDVIRFTRGDLYVELDGDGKSARVARKPGDTKDPTAKVEIDDQGGVSIETDGDISVSAGGDVVIDEGGSAKSVLTEDAVFEYEDTGDTSDGSAGTTTKTTTKVSNGETTSTDIE